MTTYWCESAWLGEVTGRVASAVAIEVADGFIVDVRPGVEVPSGAVRLTGLTVPGLANAHSHAFHRALRGRTHGDGGSFWTWRERMYDLAERLDPDSYRRLATAVFAEMVLAGFTCVGEFHYLHHDRGGRAYAQPNAMGDVLCEAAQAAGIRITLLDACYLRAGAAADGARPELSPVQRRFSDGDADRWAGRVADLRATPMARIGAAIHSVRAVDTSSIERVVASASGSAAPLHSHVSEQPRENEECVAAHGCTPAVLLDRHGALGPRFTAIHATHLVDADLAVLAATRSGVCMCPTTERDLADGIGPSHALRANGIPISIGSDSHAVIDPFEEARGIELDERLRSLRRGTHLPGELMASATECGYASLGWPEGGRIATGALADLTTVSLDSPRLAGTDASDALASVVFSATAADVRHVIVAGEVIVADGRHRSLDVGATLHDSIAAVWA